jgi:NADH-quinone oxidoreductase subunit N
MGVLLMSDAHRHDDVLETFIVGNGNQGTRIGIAKFGTNIFGFEIAQNIKQVGHVETDIKRITGVVDIEFFDGFFLYGFVLIYGGTGTTNLAEVSRVMGEQMAQTGSINPLAMIGLVLGVVGIGFKIAAVPMHFYTPDVYQGASPSVAAMLAFVPKTAGFIGIILLASTVGWVAGDGHGRLPSPLHEVLWIMAALTMTVGNVLAILQHSVKRVLAYSSIAHSGYMLVGLIAGPGSGAGLPSNGLGATLFYLLCYGVMNLGAFAVLACIERGPRDAIDGTRPEVETVDDLRGLCKSHPLLGWTMILCALSLLGMPPLLGFFGKLFLFTSALAAGELVLVIVLGLNSAIAAFYYLRLVAAPYLEPPDRGVEAPTLTMFPARLAAAVLSAAGVVLLVLPAGRLMRASDQAGAYRPADATPSEVAAPPDAAGADPVASRDER